MWWKLTSSIGKLFIIGKNVRKKNVQHVGKKALKLYDSTIPQRESSER